MTNKEESEKDINDEINKYKKGTLGWLREQAKKDGFYSIRDWQNWKIEKINELIKNGEFEQSWTKEKVCDIIRNFVKEKGRNPVVTDFDNNPKYPSINIIWSLFGSFNDALREAGYCGGNKKYTTKNRIHVSFDGINFFWAVYENTNGKLIMNPTKDDLYETKLKTYNSTNVCSICREEWEKEGQELTDKSVLRPKNARRFDIGNDEIWVCESHSGRYRQKLPNSQNNIRKSLADCRTGNSTDPTKILGNNCEKLTEKWLGAGRLSVKYDNYSNLPLDHDPIPNGVSVEIGRKLVDLSGMVPQTKSRCYSPEYGYWNTDTSTEHDKKFDILIFYCISEDWKTVERIYIIPKKEIIKSKSITIHKNIDIWNNPVIPYEKYQVTEEELKKINDIWGK